MKKSFFLIFLSEIEFYIAQASLKLADPLEFTSRVLGVHALPSHPVFHQSREINSRFLDSLP